jgi:tetrahydromethanopterin S-methyltransferase subunit G
LPISLESFNLGYSPEGNAMENVENLVPEQLRVLRNDILAFRSENQSEFSEIKHRLTRVESSIASMRGENVGTQEDVYRQQSVIDSIKERLQRIERRLEIVE